MTSPSQLQSDYKLLSGHMTDRLARDLARFFAGLPLSKPDVCRNALLEYGPALTDLYGSAAASLAASYYEDLRGAQAVTGAFTARAASPTPVRIVERVTKATIGGLWTGESDSALVNLTGALIRSALEPGRETIRQASLADPKASGWQRTVSGKGCGFCRMLAGNGGVYREARAKFGAHDHCKCSARPSFDDSAPEVPVDAYEASRRTSSMTPEQKAVHNARARAWIKENDA